MRRTPTHHCHLTRSIQVCDVDSGDVRIVSGFDISPDGELAAIGMHRRRDDDWFVRVVRTDDGSVVADLDMLGLSRCVYFKGDGSRLFAAEERYHRRPNRFAVYVYQWDVQRGEKLHQWGPFPMTGFKRRGGTVNFGVTHLSADGKLLASPHGDRVVVMDVASSNYTAVGPHPTLPIAPGPLAGGEFGGGAPPYRTLAFDPSGYRLATGCIASSSVYFWPLAGSDSPDHLDQPGLYEVRWLQFSPSGRFLAVSGRGSDGGKIHVWRMDTIRSDSQE